MKIDTIKEIISNDLAHIIFHKNEKKCKRRELIHRVFSDDETLIKFIDRAEIYTGKRTQELEKLKEKFKAHYENKGVKRHLPVNLAQRIDVFLSNGDRARGKPVVTHVAPAQPTFSSSNLEDRYKEVDNKLKTLKDVQKRVASSFATQSQPAPNSSFSRYKLPPVVVHAPSAVPPIRVPRPASGGYSEQQPLLERNDFQHAPLLFECGFLENPELGVNANAVNFAIVNQSSVNDLLELVPVSRKLAGGSWQRYNASSEQLLYKIITLKRCPSSFEKKSAVDMYFSSSFLGENTLQKEAFLRFLMEDTDHGSGDSPRIVHLRPIEFLHVCKMAEGIGQPIDLTKKIGGGVTIFHAVVMLCSPRECQLLLDAFPDVLKQRDAAGKSLLIDLCAKGNMESAKILLQVCEERQVALDAEEIVCKKAIEGKMDFSDEEFHSLRRSVQEVIFTIANHSNCKELVRRLKALGVSLPESKRAGPSSLSLNSDIVQKESYLYEFLKDLRRDNALFTHSEFSQRNSDAYVAKRDQIGRIQGAQFIRECIVRYKLKHVKVPKKIVVVQPNVNMITLKFDASLEIATPWDQDEESVRVYAEKITQVQRKISLAEAIEWMIALEVTGFNDFAGVNFFIAKDGIYFIDTEYGNFTPEKPSFEAIRDTISSCLEPKDVPAFLAEYEKRKRAFMASTSSISPNTSSLSTLAQATQRVQYSFSVEELLK